LQLILCVSFLFFRLHKESIFYIVLRYFLKDGMDERITRSNRG